MNNKMIGLMLAVFGFESELTGPNQVMHARRWFNEGNHYMIAFDDYTIEGKIQVCLYRGEEKELDGGDVIAHWVL